MHSRSLKSIAIALVLIVVIALVYLYATPYLALNRIERAIHAHDAQTVSQYIDYPALRESMSEQLSALLNNRIEEQKLSHPLNALNALIGKVMIQTIVDSYVTPEGVAAMLNGVPPRGNPGEHPPALDENNADNAAQPSSGPASPSKQISTGYRDMDNFVVVYKEANNETGHSQYSLVFHRYGWVTWKLAAVEFSKETPQ